MAEVDQTLNPRVAALKPSKTMALTDLASSMKASGVDVISLAAGLPDFPTPPVVCAAAHDAIHSGKTKYTPNAGTPALRQAIVQKLAIDNGLHYSDEEVVVSNGAKQSIWQAILACLSPGDEVIVPAPYWVSYPEMVRLAGGVPVVVGTAAEDNYCMTAAQLSQALSPKTRLVILCNPSNPAGTVYSRQALEGLSAAIAAHPRAMVVSDEIYELLVYTPRRHHSFAAIPGMWERTFTVNGVSKAFAMTGWRVGYLAAPAHFARACAIIQSQSTSGACSVSQEAAECALRLGPGGGETVREMVSEFEKRRDFVVNRLRSIPDLSIVEPQGAFYVLPDFSAYFGPRVTAEGFGNVPDGEALCEYLLKVAHVATVPGSAFGAPNCVRLSYAASLDTLDTALSRIAEHLAPDRFHR